MTLDDSDEYCVVSFTSQRTYIIFDFDGFIEQIDWKHSFQQFHEEIILSYVDMEINFSVYPNDRSSNDDSTDKIDDIVECTLQLFFAELKLFYIVVE